MEFKINEDFAKRYNQYRQKEEYQKLKSRFGDVKVSKKSAKKKADDDETDTDSDSSSSSSSSTSSGAEEWEQKEHEDFLRLYDALCRGDPAVNDPNKTWFRPRPEEGDKEGGQDDAGSKKKSAEKPLLLKDHVRELLLSGESADPAAEDGSDPKRWNGKKGEDPSIQKNAFLRETEALFEIADGEEAPLLQRKVSSPANAEDSTKTSGEKSLPDTSHFTFAINGTDADQEFLRDYIVNRRWKSAESAKGAKKQPRKNEDSPDALVDALRDATASATRKDHSETTDLLAAEDLDADDEFLVKARQFEYRWNNNDLNLAAEYPHTTAVRSRFEEDDHEFIKSYPRNITSTLRQPTPGKLTRAEKRKAREERKRQKKAAKMAELQHLKRLKMAEFAEKLERIRKTCGDGVSLGPLNRFTNATTEEENAEATAEEEEETVAEEVVDALENDWNPEEHDRLVQKLFGSEYYGATTGDDDLDEPPTFSDDDDDDDDGDLNSGRYHPRRRHRDEGVQDLGPAGDEEEVAAASSEGHSHASAIERAAKDLEGTLAPRSHGRKRAHVGSRLKAALDRRKPLYDPTKNPDFEKYFDEFYQLDCEDILTGSRPGEDIHCRFKYREVKPNDFGLTTEEILAADDKELNRYASVKLMSVYRTEEEEERDVRKYHRQKMQLKKRQLIPSLLQSDGAEEGQDSLAAATPPAANAPVETDAATQPQLSKKTLKRLRKKAKKSLLADSVAQEATSVQSSEDARPSTQASHSSASERKHNRQASAAAADAGQDVVVSKRHRHSEGTTEQSQPPAKKHRHSSKPKISAERLQAAGIDAKQFRYMRFEKERK
ncbi:KRRI-Interacting protein 1 [Sparganum proliferum]